VRKPWSSEEMHLVMHTFRKNVADGSIPGNSLFEYRKKKYSSVLYGRSREQVTTSTCLARKQEKRKQAKQKTRLCCVF